MRPVRSPRWGVLALALAAGFAYADPAAGLQAQYDHTPAIEGLLRSAGGADRLSSAQPRQLATLYAHLQGRGSYYLSLHEFQRSLGADYSAFRDTVSASVGIKVPWASYYLGRHLQEMGDVDGARAAYRRAQGNDVVGSDARAWAASLDGSGSGWPTAYWRWRSGEATGAPSCGASAPPACRLLAALVSDDLAAIGREQTRLAREEAPVDRSMTLPGATDGLGVEFFDPSLPLLMAAADFRMAAAALAPFSEARPATLRGIALTEARRYTDAISALRPLAGDRAQGPLAKVYLGKALWETGNRREAEQLWTEASRGAPEEAVAHLLAVWAGIAHPRTGTQVRERASSVEVASTLARGLLRADRVETAVDVMTRGYDPLWGTNLAKVRPDYLAIMAHARYEAGRDYWGLARELFVPLQRQFPMQSGAVAMLQELSTPTRPPTIGMNDR